VSESFEPDTVNVAGLDKLLKALKAKPPNARVGILGPKDARKEGEVGNADIGAAHEYGDPGRGLPQRSFLRIPLADNLQKAMESEGAFSEEELKEVLRSGSVMAWLKKVAVLAEGVVREAFDLEGPGWPEWSDPDYENNTGKILQDTQQLRESIISEVKEP
jgi:hypothetical protein